MQRIITGLVLATAMALLVFLASESVFRGALAGIGMLAAVEMRRLTQKLAPSPALWLMVPAVPALAAWHAAGGPDTLRNGMALCPSHHAAFDRGFYTLDDERRWHVSSLISGGEETQRMLIDMHGRSLLGLQRGKAQPAKQYLEGHRAEVFRGPARAA